MKEKSKTNKKSKVKTKTATKAIAPQKIKLPENKKKQRPKKNIEAKEPKRTVAPEAVVIPEIVPTINIQLQDNINEEKLTHFVEISNNEIKKIFDKNIAHKQELLDIKRIFDEIPALECKMGNDNKDECKTFNEENTEYDNFIEMGKIELNTTSEIPEFLENIKDAEDNEDEIQYTSLMRRLINFFKWK